MSANSSPGPSAPGAPYEAMLRIYCRDKHGGALCPRCQELERYVSLRLDRCQFGSQKPTCANCLVHCYQRERREEILAVMRYAGPRMIWKHPWMSLCHLADGWFWPAAPLRK